MNRTLHVRILNPQKVLFAQEALSVSSINSSGKFDILPEHANFITVIDNKPITIRVKGQKPQAFSFPVAIIYNNNNQVNIYTV